MNPYLASRSAIAMRRRHIRRRRIERVAVVAYHTLAALGVLFIVALVAGWL